MVAVWSPDRLARKYAYQVLLLEEFRRVGCEVVFLQHPISDDPNDQLLLQIQGAMAEGSVASFHLRELPLCFSTEGEVVEGRYDQLQREPI
jgi:site-specific DNA recombinase